MPQTIVAEIGPGRRVVGLVANAPYFDGELGSILTVDGDPQYSQPYANVLSVAAWICPLALDNTTTQGVAV